MNCPETEKACETPSACTTACIARMAAINPAAMSTEPKTVTVAALERLADEMEGAAGDCYSDTGYEQGKRCAEMLRDFIRRS